MKEQLQDLLIKSLSDLIDQGQLSELPLRRPATRALGALDFHD